MTGSKTSGRKTVSGDQGDDAVDKGIAQMYKIYEKLNSAADKTTLEGEFRELLSAVKRSEKEKRLASQFITRFLESFPLLYDEAINALLDLCEDEDISIRKQVCKDLIIVCKKVSTFVPKIADVFAQLMQTDDNSEHKQLESCLVSLFHIDAQAALVGIFSQVVNGDDIVRERCLKFLSNKLKDLSPEIVNSEFEKCLFSEARRTVASCDLSGDEFEILYDVLMKTKLLKTVSGQQMLVDVLADTIDLKRDFDSSEKDNFDKLFVCTKLALKLFSNQISSSAFFVYYCNKVIPNLGEAVMVEDGGNLKLEALRLMADVASHTKHLELNDVKTCILPVFKDLIEYLPRPSESEEELNPKFDFSHIECLLYCLHKLGGFFPEFLTSDEQRFKDFKQRLTLLARGTQAYMKRLREDLTGKRGAELRTDENRTKIQALKLTSNVTQVIKDFFHNPPIYKATPGLSWRPLARNTASPGLKRSLSTESATIVKSNRGIYQPPSGKFSSRAGTYSSPKHRGMRGGFMGRRPGRGGRGRY